MAMAPSFILEITLAIEAISKLESNICFRK